jgi:opacity protein-like surface antigen
MHKILVLAAALAMAGAASAQVVTGQPRTAYGSTGAMGPWSAELGYSSLDIESGGVGFKPGAVRLMLGYSVHPNVAVEGMAAFNANDDSSTVRVGAIPVSVDAELRRSYGLFVKPKIMLGDRFEVFGRLGWVESKIRVSGSVPGAAFSASDSGNDVAYGAGANWYFARNVYAGLDYMNWYDKGGTKIDGWTFNIGTRF